MSGKTHIMITGAAGYLGSKLTERFLDRIKSGSNLHLICTDIRPDPFPGADRDRTYFQSDIRDPKLSELFSQHPISIVYHLAAILNPPPGMSRKEQHEIDVEATRKILEMCVQSGVERIVVTSSGAAYGYRPDNPDWLNETHPLRPNEDYPYSWHKFQVEELMQEYQTSHPELKQFIFRIGTILGKDTDNLITDMLKREPLILIKGSETPFVAIWDEDVLSIFVQALESSHPGTYNVAGDGALGLAEIGEMQGSPTRSFHARTLRWIFRVLRIFRLTQYGPDQVKFIQYRPVLSNEKLKNVYGYTPEKSSEEAIRYYLSHQNRLK